VIHLGGRTFELVQEYRNGYNFEAFRDRYSEVLDRYDYIVGDWGYNQLRLKGFFKESSRNGNKDSCVSSLQDYLNEYCNFGCAYFVLRKVHGKNSDVPAPGPNPDDAAIDAAAVPSAQQTGQTSHHSGGRPHASHRQERYERHERHERAERHHHHSNRHDRHDRNERYERSARPQQPSPKPV
jgi:uncharacterized protein YutD